MAEFAQFVVRGVELTDTTFGSGTYSSVKEAYVTGAKCAAKVLREQTLPGDPLVKLAEGCRRWNDIRHPNIVQFLGVYFPKPDSRIPVLLMEAMDTTLYHFLKSKRTGDIPLGLKIALLHNVACGVAYLHGQLGTVHGHLSANRVLLNSGMVAKISADVGVSVLPRPLQLSPYMPPEITDGKSPKKQAIDIFSIGILSIFTITKELPEHIPPPSYTEESKGLVVRNELERREKYLEKIYSQLRRSHPLVQLIEGGLNSLPESRPSITEILSLLRQAKIEIPDHFQEETKVELAHRVASLSKGFLKMKDEFERHVNEMQCQMKGLLQGMATQRKMLPQNDEHSTETELVEEQEIVYIVNFLEGIRASDLGLALGITTESLDIIDADYRSERDENKKRVAVLKEWLRNCSSSTWSALVEAMCTIGQKRMADIISNAKGIITTFLKFHRKLYRVYLNKQ